MKYIGKVREIDIKTRRYNEKSPTWNRAVELSSVDVEVVIDVGKDVLKCYGDSASCSGQRRCSSDGERRSPGGVTLVRFAVTLAVSAGRPDITFLSFHSLNYYWKMKINL